MAETSSNNTSLDTTRIDDHTDQVLLDRLTKVFTAFTNGDADELRSLQSEDYTMTNSHWGMVRVSRAEWYERNKHLTALVANLRVTALTLSGSSEPGQASLFEHVTTFELRVDPPPQLEDRFPPGTKAGDTVAINNLSVIWWDKEGLVSQEFEYGGLTGKGFSFDQWDGVRG